MRTKCLKYIFVRLAFASVLPAIPQSPPHGTPPAGHVCTLLQPAVQAAVSHLNPHACAIGQVCRR